MEPLSRRGLLGLTGGATSAALLGGRDHAVQAATGRRLRVRLQRSLYLPGQRMVLHVDKNVDVGRRIRVRDSSGLVWRKVRKSRTKQVWTAKATVRGASRVTVAALWENGRPIRNRRHRDAITYQVVGGASALIGMNASAADWAERVAEVGPGLGARRIFADLSHGASSQINLVEAAHAAGMLPVISYKVGGDVAGAVSGRFNAVAAQAAALLASYGLPTAVTFWHEPFKDMTGAQYAAASKQILPAFKRGQLQVGPLLNGWLLDGQLSTFASFCPDDLFGLWDWFGIDTYEGGTPQSPGVNKPGERIPVLSSYLRSRGHDLPLGIGEYNGYSAATVAAAGEAILSNPNVWFGCLWNVTGGTGQVLTGDRLTAFRDTLADSRRVAPRTVR